MKTASVVLMAIGVAILVGLMPLSEHEARHWFFGQRGAPIALVIGPSLIVIGGILFWLAWGPVT